MAKVPFTHINKQIAKGIANSRYNSEDRIPPCVIIESDGSEDSVEDIIRLSMETASRVSRSADAVNCAENPTQCPPVYIPVILVFKEFDGDNASQNWQVSNVDSLQVKYNRIAGEFNKLNNIFSGVIENYEDNPSAFVKTHQEISSDVTIEAFSPFETRKIQRLHEFGYYTGAKIYNKELEKLVDEYVSHRELHELYPNIRFFLPEKLKTSYIIDGIYSESSGCKVNFNSLINYLGASDDGAFKLLQNEYVYFSPNYPGAFICDSNVLDRDFYTKLNVLQNVVNGNSTPLKIVSRLEKRRGYGSAITEDSIYKVDYFWLYEFPSIFKNLAYQVNCDGYKDQAQWASPLAPYKGLTVTSGNSYPARFIMHEFGHGMGRPHSFEAPSFANKYAHSPLLETNGDIKRGTSIRIPGSGTIYNDASTVSSSELSNSMLDFFQLNFDLKPPFTHEYKNPNFDKIQRDSIKANAEYEALINLPIVDAVYDGAGLGNVLEDFTTQDINQEYYERKNLLSSRLNQTSEFIQSDFYTISDDEKGFIEFVWNKAIPVGTNNFSGKLLFDPGDEETPSLIRKYGSYSKAIRDSKLDDVMSGALSGLQSFWGGSVILKNPPSIGSLYNNDYVLSIKEQRHAVQFRGIEEGNTINNLFTFIYNTNTEIDEVTLFITNYNQSTGETWRLPTNSEAQDIYNLAVEMYPDASGGNTAVARFFPTDTSVLNFFVGEGTEVTAKFYPLENTISSYGLTSVNNESQLILIKETDLLADDTIATQFVVNPTNDDGTRKGPNVTTRIPFCKRTQPNVYDPFWAVNFNTFNPSYDAYPDNTPVDNLLDPEFCPCLHETQTFQNGDGNIYEFKIIGGGDNAWAAHAMLGSGRATLITAAEAANSEEFETGDRVFALNFSAYANPLNLEKVSSLSSVNSFSYSMDNVHVDNVVEQNIRYTAIWLTYVTSRYKNGYSTFNSFDVNGITDLGFYKYNDSEQTVLNLPVFSGYAGVGWNTTIPRAYKQNLKKRYEQDHLPVNPSHPDQELINFKLNIPDEYFLGTGSNYDFDSDCDGGQSYASRNSTGSQNPGSNLYNPLYQKYYNETAGYKYSWWDSGTPGESNYVIGDRFFPYDGPLEYHQDLYGEYTPLGFNDHMGYSDVELCDFELVFPKHIIKKYNYHFNSDVHYVQNFKEVYDSHLEESSESLYNIDHSSKSGFQIILERLATYVKNSDIEGFVGGCNDPNAFNYDPNATYDDGSCVAKVFGCLEEWAENYMHQIIDGTLVFNDGINTEDGTCFTTLCTNPDAAGEYGAGYNLPLVSQVQSYGSTYNVTALTESPNTLVEELNSGDYSSCQFTLIPRRSILRLTCTQGNNPNDIEGAPTCNNNPTIRFIQDRNTKAINSYTLDPEVIELPLLDFVAASASEEYFDNGIQKPKYLNYGVSSSGTGMGLLTILGNPFPSNIEGDIVNTHASVVGKICNATVFDNPHNFHSYILNNNQQIALSMLYNCVENPILPDGSGGCMLYSYSLGSQYNNELALKYQACVFGELQSQTTFDCESSSYFEGGYITDTSFLTNPDITAGYNCPDEQETLYIVGGELAAGISPVSENNGAIITSSELPNYQRFVGETDTISGYPEDILISDLIPQVESRAYHSSKTVSFTRHSNVNEHVNTIGPFNMTISIFFYKKDGSVYTGQFVFEEDPITHRRTFYEYFADESLKSTRGEELYYRNTLPNKKSIRLTEQELLFKKMYKVINKIINLTIFTDN